MVWCMQSTKSVLTKAGIATFAVALMLLATGSGSALVPNSLPLYSQGFEDDDSGWSPSSSTDEVVRVGSGSGSDEEYAPGVASASGDYHARLRIGDFLGGFGNFGPSTNWGGTLDGEGNGEWPLTGYITQVRIYVDTEYAADNPDARFDFSSAINRPSGDHLRDFAFNAGTAPSGDGTLLVSGSNNAFRCCTWPGNPDRDPVAIDTDGWYTFRHTFSDNEGTLDVLLQILDEDGTEVGKWELGGDPMEDVGGFRYGWFANNEIDGLAIDDSLRVPGGPVGELLADDL